MFNNILMSLVIVLLCIEIKMIVDGIKEVYREIKNWTE